MSQVDNNANPLIRQNHTQTLEASERHIEGGAKAIQVLARDKMDEDVTEWFSNSMRTGALAIKHVIRQLPKSEADIEYETELRCVGGAGS